MERKLQAKIMEKSIAKTSSKLNEQRPNRNL